MRLNTSEDMILVRFSFTPYYLMLTAALTFSCCAVFKACLCWLTTESISCISSFLDASFSFRLSIFLTKVCSCCTANSLAASTIRTLSSSSHFSLSCFSARSSASWKRLSSHLLQIVGNKTIEFTQAGIKDVLGQTQTHFSRSRWRRVKMSSEKDPKYIYAQEHNLYY